MDDGWLKSGKLNELCPKAISGVGQHWEKSAPSHHNLAKAHIHTNKSVIYGTSASSIQSPNKQQKRKRYKGE